MTVMWSIEVSVNLVMFRFPRSIAESSWRIKKCSMNISNTCGQSEYNMVIDQLIDLVGKMWFQFYDFRSKWVFLYIIHIYNLVLIFTIATFLHFTRRIEVRKRWQYQHFIRSWFGPPKLTIHAMLFTNSGYLSHLQRQYEISDLI